MHPTKEKGVNQGRDKDAKKDDKKNHKKQEKNKENGAPKKEKKVKPVKLKDATLSPKLVPLVQKRVPEQPKSQKNNKNNKNSNNNAVHKALNKNKEKSKENHKGNKKVLRQNEKSTGQFFRKVFKIMFYAIFFAVTFLGYLYVVDVERYRTMRDRGVRVLNSTVYLLPVEVVVKGQQAIEFIRPTVEVAVGKFQVLVNQTSVALNRNPVLKDHWSNIKEICAIIGERLAEYMRTVYRQIPTYYDAKNKLF